MLISHSHRFVFVHLERTGGTSIFHTLKRWAAPPPAPPGGRGEAPIAGTDPHLSARALRALLGEATFAAYFKFSFVRNPWERELSLFDHARGDAHHSHHALFQRLSFDDYVYWRQEQPLPTQSALLTDLEGQLLVDRVGRFERLREDFSAIVAQLGLPPLDLPRLNIGPRPRRDYRASYTPATEELVAALWREDIERFGYQF